MADLLEAIASLPPQAQAFALVFLGFGAGAYLLYAFIARQKAALEEARGRPHRAALDAIGIGLSDTLAMDRLRDEMREIRAIAERSAAATERANEILSDIAKAAHEVAEAVNHLAPPSRRRR